MRLDKTYDVAVNVAGILILTSGSLNFIYTSIFLNIFPFILGVKKID